jgi:hypothetical protein
MSQPETCTYCSIPRELWTSALCDESEAGVHVVFNPETQSEVEESRGLMVKDVEVFASDILYPGQALFCPPGHQLNPTNNFILAVDIVAYVSLESGHQPSITAAEAFVEAAWGDVRAKVRAAHRRAKRNRRRLDNTRRGK